jgi:hypothetical protein
VVVLSLTLIVLGVAQVIAAATRGAGAVAYGLGVLFVAAGVARLRLATRGRRRPPG